MPFFIFLNVFSVIFFVFVIFCFRHVSVIVCHVSFFSIVVFRFFVCERLGPQRRTRNIWFFEYLNSSRQSQMSKNQIFRPPLSGQTRKKNRLKLKKERHDNKKCFPFFLVLFSCFMLFVIFVRAFCSQVFSCIVCFVLIVSLFFVFVIFCFSTFPVGGAAFFLSFFCVVLPSSASLGWCSRSLFSDVT